MMRQMNVSPPLAAANLVAAALVIWPWLAGAPVERVPVPRSDSDVPKLARLAPFATFATTGERPLFAPSRRPTTAEKPATVAIESRYRLQGIVTVGTARHALIAPVAGGAGLELGEGDPLEGWSVKTIASDHVVLTSPAGEATLAFGRVPTSANTEALKLENRQCGAFWAVLRRDAGTKSSVLTRSVTVKSLPSEPR